MEENKTLACTECNGRIEEYCGRYICSKCGQQYHKSYDGEGNEVMELVLEEYKGEQAESIDKKKNMTMLVVTVLCIVLICAIVIWGNFHFSNNTIKKIIEINGYDGFIDADTAEEISKIDLASDVPELSSGYSLVLFGIWLSKGSFCAFRLLS